MKNSKTRKILAFLVFAVIIVAICVVCFIVGRGHTVYFDNKTTEDESYHSYDAIDLYYKGEKVTTLNARERISVALTGQKLEVEIAYRKGKNDEKTKAVATFTLPYNLDGIVINLPAYIEGADESTYMSEFVSLAIVEDSASSEEPVSTDEFGVSTAE